MNTLLVSAGAFGLFTTAMHVLGGQVTLIRPLLKTTLTNDIKGCLLVCWHTISVYLLITSYFFIFVGLRTPNALNVLVLAIAGFYVLFAALFIVVGWYFFGYRVFYKLPQWILLLPVGLLGVLGVQNLS